MWRRIERTESPTLRPPPLSETVQKGKTISGCNFALLDLSTLGQILQKQVFRTVSFNCKRNVILRSVGVG